MWSGIFPNLNLNIFLSLLKVWKHWSTNLILHLSSFLLIINLLIPSVASWRIHWEWERQTPAVSAGAAAWRDVDVCVRKKQSWSVTISTLLTCSRDQDLNPLAQGHQTLFNDVPLGLGEGSSTRQPVDGVQHGVDHYGPVVTAGKERRTFGDERQHSRAQVTVQSQGHLCGAEGNLRTRAEVPDV